MSNKTLKQPENNENLCPLTRKRIKPAPSTKTTPHSSWKLAKLETSSPSALTAEYLEEMGIGMLDSDESCSSAASAIALAVTASTSDENSNEATPNLDAAKLSLHRMAQYRAIDSSLDSSLTLDNSSLIGGVSDTCVVGALGGKSVQRNGNNNTLDAFLDEAKLQQQQTQRKNSDKLLMPQHKKVAILGAGAGSATSTSTAPASDAAYNSNSNTNSPSAGRSTRSPLATVTCNEYYRIAKNIVQQQQQVLNKSLILIGNSNGVATPHAVVGGTTSQNALRALSPSLPCTSQQAALIKQQQLQAQHQQQQQQQQKQQAQQPQQHQYNQLQFENFFLFRQQTMREHGSDGKDHFSRLSDEIILHIFKWLPKKALIRCSYVCRRFNRCASDESLWARLDLGGRSLRAGALENILTRGVVILRLAQAELNHPIFSPEFLLTEVSFESKLQFLDLSMVSVTKPSLKMLLSRCRQLRKLSLEHVPVNDEICNEIARNVNLEALNLAMCIGLEAWSVRKMMESLKNLNSLNISWTNLSVDAVTSIVTNVTPNLMRLNLAGCRKTMFDSHLASLAKRCPQLLELDLSDCTGLTGNAINIICRFKMLEYLSLSRCYLIPAMSYTELSNLPTLTYLDVFGMLSDTAMEMLEQSFPAVGINKFIHSSVARPTVGTRRTSIWGLRTRD